ncbi:MAG: hypothetical protein ACJ8F7_22185 [Gemmataceae bacterium]
MSHDMTPEMARAILDLSFSEAIVARMGELSAKASVGTLSPDEHAEMDSLEQVGSILSVLKLMARQRLNDSQRGG